MRVLASILVIGISALMASCCSCRKGSPKVGDLESAKWELIEFEGQPVLGAPITLTFDGAKKMMYGTAPCNNFFGGYSLFEKTENNIKISGVGSTRKFCPDNMELEENFTSKIDDVTRIKMEGSNMLMMDNDGRLVAVFKSASK